MPLLCYKFYSVYDRDTEMPLIIHATAKEIQERLNITDQTFRTYVSHTKHGTRKNRYEIYLDDPEDDDDGKDNERKAN